MKFLIALFALIAVVFAAPAPKPDPHYAVAVPSVYSPYYEPAISYSSYYGYPSYAPYYSAYSPYAYSHYYY